MINRELIRLKVVQLVYAFYQNEGKPSDVAEKELQFSLSKAYDLYQHLLLLLVDLRNYAQRKAEALEARSERLKAPVEGLQTDRRFAANRFLSQLAGNEALLEFAAKRQEWADAPAFVKKLYADATESEVFQAYLAKDDFSYEADREVVRKLYKTFICGNEELDAMLEEHSLYWNDDKEVVDSFVLKTIKRFSEAEGTRQELLPAYASDDDRQFAERLFRETLAREGEVRDLIRNNSKNWEFSRLAFMDVVIMQIALTEILCFPQIPLSVSFNEYLDMARYYSTPKSPGYINGLLDHVVKKLREEGRLAK